MTQDGVSENNFLVRFVFWSGNKKPPKGFGLDNIYYHAGNMITYR